MKSTKIKTLQIIHGAFCAAIFLFGLLSFLKSKETLYFNTSTDQGDAYYPLFPIMALIGVSLGLFLFKKQLSSIDNSLSLNDKVMKYQSAFVTKAAFFEGTAFLNIIALSTSSNAVFLIAAGIVFVLLLLSRPTREGVIGALNLTELESSEL